MNLMMLYSIPKQLKAMAPDVQRENVYTYFAVDREAEVWPAEGDRGFKCLGDHGGGNVFPPPLQIFWLRTPFFWVIKSSTECVAALR